MIVRSRSESQRADEQSDGCSPSLMESAPVEFDQSFHIRRMDISAPGARARTEIDWPGSAWSAWVRGTGHVDPSSHKPNVQGLHRRHSTSHLGHLGALFQHFSVCGLADKALPCRSL